MDEFRFNYFREEFPLKQSAINFSSHKTLRQHFRALAGGISKKLSKFKVSQLTKIESAYLNQYEQNRLSKRQHIQTCKRWDRYI